MCGPVQGRMRPCIPTIAAELSGRHSPGSHGRGDPPRDEDETGRDTESPGEIATNRGDARNRLCEMAREVDREGRALNQIGAGRPRPIATPTLVSQAGGQRAVSVPAVSLSVRGAEALTSGVATGRSHESSIVAIPIGSTGLSPPSVSTPSSASTTSMPLVT